MASLTGQFGIDALTGKVQDSPMSGLSDLSVSLTAKTDISTVLAGIYGVGFTTPEWILLENSSVLYYEDGVTKFILE